MLLGLLDRAEVRIARLVDASLDRQQRGRVDLDDVDEPALELTVDGGRPGAAPVELRDDRDPGQSDELGERGAGRALHRVRRLDAGEDEVGRLGRDDLDKGLGRRDRIAWFRVDTDCPVGSHGEAAP